MLKASSIESNNVYQISTDMLKNEVVEPVMDFIKFPSNRGFHYISHNSILYLKSESNYTYVYFADGRSQLYSKTLKFISSFLPADQFVRIHQSYAINKNYIRYITRHFLTIDNNVMLPISRRLQKTIKL